MNKKRQHILLILGLLIVLHLLGDSYYFRLDLTADKRYTLSSITKEITSTLKSPLLIRVYLEGEFPSEFNRLQTETRQFLDELEANNSNIRAQFLNPEGDEKRLVSLGMIPSQLTIEENGKLTNVIIFPWAEIVYQNKTQIVSLLPNSVQKSQEQQLEVAIENLEHSFASGMKSVSQQQTKKIAVLSGNGQLEDIYLHSLLKEVSKKYKLGKFTLDSTEFNPNKTLDKLSQFDLALVAKPKEAFSENEKLLLDQYFMKGGKLIWMLDNVQADTDSLYNNGQMLAYPKDLNLTDLLFQYGVRVNNQLVKDLYASKITLATGRVGNQQQFEHLPWFYHPLVLGNPNHVITKNTEPIRLRFANTLDTLQNNIKKTPLLVSSLLTRKIGTPNIIELESIEEEPLEQDYQAGPQLFGVLLEGEFTSAYKNRIKPFDTNIFLEKSTSNKMVVIADGDIAKNQILKGQPHPLEMDKWTGERFGNKQFLLNTIDYLLDDTGLISLRNKSLQIRLLDKQRAFKEQRYWQLINVISPLICLAIIGFGFQYYRKKKYTQTS